MLLALSKFLPRAFHRKARSKTFTSTGDGCNEFTCRILLLDDTEFKLDIKLNSKGSVLLERVYDHLCLHDREYFGLRFLDEENHLHWLEPSKSLQAQLTGAAPYMLYFGVKFYPADPCRISEENTRYQFFLQLRQDIHTGRIPVSSELGAQLAALVVQSELGDFNPNRHQYGYVSEFRFVPGQTEEFECRVAHLHRGLSGQVPSRVEYQFLDKVKWLDMYGVQLHPVIGDGNIDYFLGLSPTGIIIYKNKNKVSNYFWPRLLKITFKGKLFMVRVRDGSTEENTYTFECTSKQICKQLWKSCVEHHSFFRSTSVSQSYNQSSKLSSGGSKNSHSGVTVERNSSVNSGRASSRKRISGSESCPEDITDMPQPMSTKSNPPLNTRRPHRQSGYSSEPEAPRNIQSWGVPNLNQTNQSWGAADNKNNPPWQTVDSNQPCKRYPPGRGGSPTSVRSEYFPKRCLSVITNDNRNYTNHQRVLPSDSEAEYECRSRRARAISDVENVSVDIRFRHGQRSHLGGSYMPGTTVPYQMPHCQSNRSIFSASESMRRQRRRSKSPGCFRPPDELAQHFSPHQKEKHLRKKVYIDPTEEGMTEDQLRDIPYTLVQTDVTIPKLRYSPRTRHRMRIQKRQKSQGDLFEASSRLEVPDGEAPPPYLSPPSLLLQQRPSFAKSMNSLQCKLSFGQPSTNVLSPIPVNMTETQTAPIVKTKTLPTYSNQLTSDQSCMRNMHLPGQSNSAEAPKVNNNKFENSSLMDPSSRTAATPPSIPPMMFRPRTNESFNDHFSRMAAVPPAMYRPTTTTICTDLPARTDKASDFTSHIREDSGLELDSPGGSRGPDIETHSTAAHLPRPCTYVCVTGHPRQSGLATASDLHTSSSACNNAVSQTVAPSSAPFLQTRSSLCSSTPENHRSNYINKSSIGSAYSFYGSKVQHQNPHLLTLQTSPRGLRQQRSPREASIAPYTVNSTAYSVEQASYENCPSAEMRPRKSNYVAGMNGSSSKVESRQSSFVVPTNAPSHNNQIVYSTKRPFRRRQITEI